MGELLPPAVAARLAALRQEMKKLRVPALLVTNMYNVRYLSGFTGSEAVLLITARGQLLLTDSRYTAQAATQARGYEIILTQRRPEDLAASVHQLRLRRLAFEPDGLTHGRFLDLQKKMKGVKLVPMNDFLRRLRARKSLAEIRAIRRAAAIARRAFRDVLPWIRPGMREREFAARLDARLRELGSEKIPFDTIVASGHRGALPHGIASEKKMKSGELITVDFGAVWQGYQADQTITFSLGRPSARLEKIYQVVREAHDRAIALIRPGISARQVDAAARGYIKASSLGKYFGHGLGHGVGLETHEAPVLSSRSRDVLEEGNVVTVEPGIYIPGVGGVRIEDMVVVTGSGARLLTASSGPLRRL